MTPNILENISTWLVDWSLVTIMGNTTPPRDPNDENDEDDEDDEGDKDDEDDEDDENDDTRGRTSRWPTAIKTRRCVYSAPRFLRARYYLRFPDLRDSDASTLRTSDWEIPNCLAIRVGVIPALKVARTALTWPGVNATFGSSGCRRSGDSSVVVD
jgi:hypothetical protein